MADIDYDAIAIRRRMALYDSLPREVRDELKQNPDYLKRMRPVDRIKMIHAGIVPADLLKRKAQ